MAAPDRGLAGAVSAERPNSATRRVVGWARIAAASEHRIWIVVVALGVLGTLSYPQFATLQNLANIVTQATPTAFLAIGVSLVLITGEIDLSVGSLVSLTSVMIANWMGAEDRLILPVLCLVLLVGGLVGAANGMLTTRFSIPSFITTLSMLLILQSVNLVWTAGGPASDLAPAFAALAGSSVFGVPVSASILILVVLAGWFILYRTVLGRRFFLVGANPRAAHIAGLGVGRTRVQAFVLCGILAAMGGAFLTSYVGSGQSWLGSGLELTAIASAVIGGVDLFGGRGSATGAAGGAVLLTVIFNLLIIAGVPAAYNPVVTGALLILGIGFNLVSDGQGRLGVWFARRRLR
jgi:ribose/xylose/arabinose/galactoside ABC-type transport system permease subunit